MQQKDIMNVRRAVDANIGRRVRVRANKGRHKYSVAEGVIQESYPSIFTVRINADEDNAERVVSYSYTDVLTRDVQPEHPAAHRHKVQGRQPFRLI